MASKFTSFVGVDKKTRKSVFDSAMVTREVRQEIPVDYGCSLFDDDSDVDEEENIKGGAGNMMGAMGGALKGGFASDPCKKYLIVIWKIMTGWTCWERMTDLQTPKIL